MRFTFDARKTAQAACWLINRAGGSMNYMVLIKLLYLADRQSLIETGVPITGDRMVSMPNGPVLSRVLDHISMGEPIAPVEPIVWYEYVSEPTKYEVTAKKAPETDELSRYELGVLEGVLARFGEMSIWALRDWTHTLPEWDDPNGSSKAIEPDTILRLSGRSDTEIREMTEMAEELWFMNNLARIAHHVERR